MKVHLTDVKLLRKLPCLVLAMWLGAAPISSTFAQGFGAIQAVRGAADRLGQGAGSPQGEGVPPGTVPPGPGPGPEGGPGYGMSVAAGKLDTTYVPANASVLIVIRPAQIFASPAAQALPLDVLTAAARQQFGVDPTEVDEIVLFGDVLTQAHGMAVKFKNPFRAASIPQPLLAGVKLSEFNGKKYLQGMGPAVPSMYGPNNKTLLVAPDEMLKQIVQSAANPKAGPLIDRVRDVSSGSDLYALVDLTRIKPMLPMFAGAMLTKVPPDKKALAEAALEGITGAEINVNLTARGPISAVLRFADEAAAQKVEMAIAAMNQAEAAVTEAQPVIEQGPPENPLSQLKAQFKEKLKQKYQPQRNGADISFLHIEAEDPLQPQLLPMLIGAAMRDELDPGLKSLEGFTIQGMIPGPPGVGAGPGVPPAGVPPEGAAPGVAPPPGTPPAGPEGQQGLPN